MKIESTKEKLIQVISPAHKVAGKKLSLPVLSCVHLEAKGALLSVRATNLDLGLEAKIPVRVMSEGSVAVPAEILLNFLSGVSGDTGVSLVEAGGGLSVSVPKSRIVIKTQNKEDFPTIPAVPSDNVFTLRSEDVVLGFRSVWQSASVSSIKPELSSVYMYTDGMDLVFVATDSFRLAEKRVKLKKPANVKSVLIPFKNVADVLKILEPFNTEVEFHTSSNQIALIFNSFYLVSRVVEGTFPDYKQIIPKEFASEAVLLKQDFSGALKTAHLFSDSFNQIRMEIDPKAKKFKMVTKNSEVGESDEDVPAALSGESLEINFNQKYLAEGLPSVASDSVSLSFSGKNKPLVVRGVSDASFTYLVMPMNR